MALKVRQFALAQNVATLLLPSSLFTFTAGTNADRVSVSIKNESTTDTVWIGGPDVSTTQGQSLAPGESQPFAFYKNDVPWGFTSAADTPVVSVMAAGQ